jgi:hypothetical protein
MDSIVALEEDANPLDLEVFHQIIKLCSAGLYGNCFTFQNVIKFFILPYLKTT